MRLIKPSLGECADRLTILELKIGFGIVYRRDVTHFEEERALVIAAMGPSFNGIDAALLDELRAVNRTIWDLEAKVRAILGTASDDELGQIVRIITPQNDRRAELVRAISGDSTAQEKLFA